MMIFATNFARFFNLFTEMTFDGGEFHITFKLATLICFFLCEFSPELTESAEFLSPDSKRSFSSFSFVSSFRSPVSPKERESALCKFGKLFKINTSKHVTSRSVTFFST
uniref:(northern house mosquito) hypothetical protein n=2 Tax=Culex pipiens TaxID=7175 RepID=A0A8D8MPZ3_CULPI